MLYRNSLLTKNDGSRPAYPDNRRACAHHDAPLSMRAEQILGLVAGRDLQVLHDSGEMEFVAHAGVTSALPTLPHRGSDFDPDMTAGTRWPDLKISSALVT
jgi:hypothetical protein